MNTLDLEPVTVPALPHTERSIAYLEFLKKPLTARDLANLLTCDLGLDGAFAVVETWCQQNPEKLFPKSDSEENWETMVEFLIKRTCSIIIDIGEQQGTTEFYDTAGTYLQALGERIIRDLHSLSVRGFVVRILASIHQPFVIMRGYQLALGRSFQTLKTFRGSTAQIIEERKLRLQSCSPALLQFLARMDEIIRRVHEECLRVRKKTTWFERRNILDPVEQAASTLFSSETHLPIS